jgi:hypothetical protein
MICWSVQAGQLLDWGWYYGDVRNAIDGLMNGKHISQQKENLWVY